MPEAFLPLVECRLVRNDYAELRSRHSFRAQLDFFADTYRHTQIFHEDRVDPERTECRKKPYFKVDAL